MSLESHQLPKTKQMDGTKWGEEVEQLELSTTAGRTVKWHKHSTWQHL